jgi:hypothetical protein
MQPLGRKEVLTEKLSNLAFFGDGKKYHTSHGKSLQEW